MSREYTYPHIRIPCPECRSNTYTVYDSHHAETYCLKCGTVIQDTSIFSITDYLEKETWREHTILGLWKNTKKKIKK